MGDIAACHRASLYYPAAGLDLRTFLRTGIPRAIFLDPGYFCERRMDQRSIKKVVRIIDARATFVRRARNVLSARFHSDRDPRSVTFVRGEAGKDEHLVARYEPGKTVFLAKGCLLPKVLCPPPNIQDLSPVAYAMVLPDLPKFSTTIRRGYSVKLIDLLSWPTRMVLFGSYCFMPDRERCAQQQLDALLAPAHAERKATDRSAT